MESFRTLRMVASITALLTGLFWLERVWEVWDAQGSHLVRFGDPFSGYGLVVFGSILLRVALGGACLWLFARFGSSKPLPRPFRAS